MSWRQVCEDYLSFSKRDRTAVILLAVLIILVLFSPGLFKPKSSSWQINTDTTWILAFEKLNTPENGEETLEKEFEDRHYANDRSVRDYFTPAPSELFPFDPNTIGVDEWRRLGLREKTIGTIQNFLGKGGRFRRAADLSKIYGLKETEFKRLEPYISIPEKNNNPLKTNEFFARDKTGQSKFIRSIEINSADTAVFIALPGIGSKLAERIVNFREKLGGFYSIDQVKETYGLADSVFQKLKSRLTISNTGTRKININTASLDELKSHPYIWFNLAKAIISYRNQHGLFTAIEDLKKLIAVTEEVYEKLRHYITVASE